MAKDLRLLRNHGLANRDEITFFGHNSRLDSIQAVVANRLIGQAEWITDQRIAHAAKLDQGLGDLEEFVRIPPRRAGTKQVYHTYVIRAAKRDDLCDYLNREGVEAKIHYPIPLHLQKASECLGHKSGDFPVCEEDCRTIISLPAHQHLDQNQIDYIIDQVHQFYSGHS